MHEEVSSKTHWYRRYNYMYLKWIPTLTLQVSQQNISHLRVAFDNSLFIIIIFCVWFYSETRTVRKYNNCPYFTGVLISVCYILRIPFWDSIVVVSLFHRVSLCHSVAITGRWPSNKLCAGIAQCTQTWTYSVAMIHKFYCNYENC
jgi:hypothetical protein